MKETTKNIDMKTASTNERPSTSSLGSWPAYGPKTKRLFLSHGLEIKRRILFCTFWQFVHDKTWQWLKLREELAKGLTRIFVGYMTAHQVQALPQPHLRLVLLMPHLLTSSVSVLHCLVRLCLLSTNHVCHAQVAYT